MLKQFCQTQKLWDFEMYFPSPLSETKQLHCFPLSLMKKLRGKGGGRENFYVLIRRPLQTKSCSFFTVDNSNKVLTDVLLNISQKTRIQINLKWWFNFSWCESKYKLHVLKLSNLFVIQFTQVLPLWGKFPLSCLSST